MKTLQIKFNQLIKTPLIDNEERNMLTASFNNLTDEFSMFVMCKQIEYGYCTDEFLKTIKY